MKVSRLVFWMAVAALAWVAPVRAETIRYTIAEEGAASSNAGADCASGCCDAGGCESACCESACCGADDSWTLSLFAPSDHCFDDFISPMTNPVYFEDPRTLSEGRLIFLTHKVPLAAE